MYFSFQEENRKAKKKLIKNMIKSSKAISKSLENADFTQMNFVSTSRLHYTDKLLRSVKSTSTQAPSTA